MNLVKAIELNKEVERSLKQGKRPDHADAVRIGREAAEWLLNWRGKNSTLANVRLLHETLD